MSYIFLKSVICSGLVQKRTWKPKAYNNPLQPEALCLCRDLKMVFVVFEVQIWIRAYRPRARGSL